MALQRDANCIDDLQKQHTYGEFPLTDPVGLLADCFLTRAWYARQMNKNAPVDASPEAEWVLLDLLALSEEHWGNASAALARGGPLLPHEGDSTAARMLDACIQIADAARATFKTLPAAVRSAAKNDPVTFEYMLTDETETQRLREAGLLYEQDVEIHDQLRQIWGRLLGNPDSTQVRIWGEKSQLPVANMPQKRGDEAGLSDALDASLLDEIASTGPPIPAGNKDPE